MEVLCKALRQCRFLLLLSFSKNNLGVDDLDTSSSESDESFNSDERKERDRDRKLNLGEDAVMTKLLADLARSKTEMERLCLSHC